MASRRRGDHQAAMRAAPWLLGTTQSSPNTDSSFVARSVHIACAQQLQAELKHCCSQPVAQTAKPEGCHLSDCVAQHPVGHEPCGRLWPSWPSAQLGNAKCRQLTKISYWTSSNSFQKEWSAGMRKGGTGLPGALEGSTAGVL